MNWETVNEQPATTYYLKQGQVTHTDVVECNFRIDPAVVQRIALPLVIDDLEVGNPKTEKRRKKTRGTAKQKGKRAKARGVFEETISLQFAQNVFGGLLVDNWTFQSLK